MNSDVREALEMFAEDAKEPLAKIYRRFREDRAFRAEVREAARQARKLAEHHKAEARAFVIQQTAETVALSPERVDDARDNIVLAYRTDPVMHANIDHYTLMRALQVNDPAFEAKMLELTTKDPDPRARTILNPLPTLNELGHRAKKH